MKKPNYGIDAPPVIKKLFVNGILHLFIGLACYLIINPYYHILAWIILSYCIVMFFIYFVSVAMMFWSSLIGKFIIRNKIIKSLNLKGNEVVLDVGCGKGLYLIAISKLLNQDGKAYGLDIWQNEDLSDNSEDKARYNAQLECVADKINLVSYDMRNMPFENNKFDLIISSMAIHNLPTQRDRNQALAEINRVLKPDGKSIIIDFMYTKLYVGTLKRDNFKKVTLSRLYFIMFPPIRIITALK